LNLFGNSLGTINLLCCCVVVVELL